MHENQRVSVTHGCSKSAWVGTLDLLGWGLEAGKNVCVVNGDNIMVTVYSGITLPQSVHLNEFTPNAEYIALLFVNGDHFDGLVHFYREYLKIDDFVNRLNEENRRLPPP